MTSAIPQLAFSDDDATFFTIGDAGFFPGVVGFVNSLRLVGHSERIVVADCGFTPAQRDLLRPHCTLVPLSRDDVKNPQQYKAFAYLVRPKGIVATIDSDIIITGSLRDMFASARKGKICVFADPDDRRWFAEWEQVFALDGPPRRQTYINSGFVVFSTVHWPKLLERWWQSCERIFTHPTIYEGASHGSASGQSDQDALNALLMTEIPPGAVEYQSKDGEAFRESLDAVRIVDPKSLRCTLNGTSTVALHDTGGPKHWQQAAWAEVSPRHSYTVLLRRLLVSDDVAVRVPQNRSPAWLRPGAVGRLSLDGYRLASGLRKRLPRNTGFVTRVRRLLRPSKSPSS